MKIIIIGYIDSKNPTGPSDVVNSLVKGFEELGVDFEFINVFVKSTKEKIKLYKKILNLFFLKGVVINVHTWGLKVPFMIFLMSCINKKNSYFLTVHGISSLEDKLNHKKTRKIRRILEKMLYEGMQNIVCVSNFSREMFIRNFKHDEKIYVVSNGLFSFESTMKYKGSLRFVYAGGFSELKNPIECLEIFKLILNDYPEASLTMCGPVKNEVLMKHAFSFINDNDMKNNVTIIGNVSKDELNSIYEDSYFILATSKFDTFNMTVLEAMNKGCIPIVSENCGIKDILENNCGIIYKNVRDIADKIKCMDLKEQSKKCFELSLENTYLKMAERYLGVLEKKNE